MRDISLYHYINQLFEYGPHHLIGVGTWSDESGSGPVIVLFDKSDCSLSYVMDYKIKPSSGAGTSSLGFDITVDYVNRMVILPLNTGEDYPYDIGFYYLQVEVDTRDPHNCMIHPPTTQCDL